MTRRRTRGPTEPATLVISRWLKEVYAVKGFTPFEAAEEIERQLEQAGYCIVTPDDLDGG